MLGVKEKDLQENLERWIKRMEKMKKKLDRLLVVGGAVKYPGDLEQGTTRKKIYRNLRKLIKEIEETLEQHEHGVWIQTARIKLLKLRCPLIGTFCYENILL